MYIGGEWITPASGETKAVINPATGEVVSEIYFGGREEITSAIDAADAAFPSWRDTPASERGEYLYEIANRVAERVDEIAEVLTSENGKPLSESRAEAAGTVAHFKWFAEEASRGYGRIAPARQKGKRHLIIKQPVGVAAAISPWNFPIVLSARKIAPALAAGCTTILKPSSRTPLVNVILAECIDAAGLPKGVFNLVCGPSAMIADELMSSPAVKKLSFTGSTPVGKGLLTSAGQGVKRVSMELGGNCPAIVFPDVNVDESVRITAGGKYRNGGQSCIAINRIYVHEDIYEEFEEKFTSHVKALKVGNGMSEGVDIGPMIDSDAVDNAVGIIEDARSKGADILCGGERISSGPLAEGSFLQPTVIGGATQSMRCMREEIFAPVAPLSSFSSVDEALELANDTEYGLAAYTVTNNLSLAFKVAEGLEAGTVAVNDDVPSTVQCPFGGFKQSGLGRELGMEGMDSFLETKHISIGLC
jgi:succinate-semialdehyde dehydrogenase/glutarate-semialdehyde dehydrogenase